VTKLGGLIEYTTL